MVTAEFVVERSDAGEHFGRSTDRIATQQLTHRIEQWVHKIDLCLDRFGHLRFVHDLGRDWRRWSRSERIAAVCLTTMILILPTVLVCDP